jgi:two-component system nitrogen regulation response regulator NtrX
MKRVKLLIVDDEEKILQTMKGSLEDEDYEVLTAKDGQEAMEKVRAENPELVFLDIWLPGMDGMETLKAIKEYNQNLDVVIMTGHGTMNTAIQAIKLGAFDFLEKPLSLDSIFSVIHSALEHKRSQADEAEAAIEEPDELIGESLAIMRVKKEIKKLARNGKNLFITGESGTGKEFAARLIHHDSPRRKSPFIKFSCTIYSPDEMSHNLFGTPAQASRKNLVRKTGELERAAKGTLFLDTIEEMPLSIQQELAEALKKKRGKGGSRQDRANEPRIMASSIDDPSLMVKEGKLSQELHELLAEDTIEMPPLRERKDDILKLFAFFMEGFSQKHGRKAKELDEEAQEALMNYHWPGNSKELKNFTERLVTSVPTIKITLDSLPLSMRGELASSKTRAFDRYTTLKEAETAWKKEFLIFHLKKHNVDIPATARSLGMRQDTLRRYMDTFGIKLQPAKKTARAPHQRTIKKSVVLSGEGLHSGMKSGLILSPLPPNSGIIFGNITTSDTVPAHLDFVESTDYATSLKSGQAYARTIEHFMAVLHAYHISNLQVKISGEIPIMDGSALEFCQLIEEAGIEEQDAPLEEIIIAEKYVVGEPSPESKYISIEPHPTFTVNYLLNYPSPVGRQEFSFTLKDDQAFKNLIAPARTFGFLRDIGELQKRGLASGGKLLNCILIDDEKVVNTELRFPEEFARHKILDLIGDFYLLGKPIRGLVTAQMTGHSDNSTLLKKIRDSVGPFW